MPTLDVPFQTIITREVYLTLNGTVRLLFLRHNFIHYTSNGKETQYGGG